jgi:hypothetical protein
MSSAEGPTLICPPGGTERAVAVWKDGDTYWIGTKTGQFDRLKHRRHMALIKAFRDIDILPMTIWLHKGGPGVTGAYTGTSQLHDIANNTVVEWMLMAFALGVEGYPNDPVQQVHCHLEGGKSERISLELSGLPAPATTEAFVDLLDNAPKVDRAQYLSDGTVEIVGTRAAIVLVKGMIIAYLAGCGAAHPCLVM